MGYDEDTVYWDWRWGGQCEPEYHGERSKVCSAQRFTQDNPGWGGRAAVLWDQERVNKLHELPVGKVVVPLRSDQQDDGDETVKFFVRDRGPYVYPDYWDETAVKFQDHQPSLDWMNRLQYTIPSYDPQKPDVQTLES